MAICTSETDSKVSSYFNSKEQNSVITNQAFLRTVQDFQLAPPHTAA